MVISESDNNPSDWFGTCSSTLVNVDFDLTFTFTGEHRYQLTKSQAPSSNIILRYLADKFKMPKYAKGYNPGKYDRTCTFRSIFLTRFHSDFLKGHKSRRDITRTKGKTGQLFFPEKSIYEIPNPSMHSSQKLDGRTDGFMHRRRTHNKYAPPTSS